MSATSKEEKKSSVSPADALGMLQEATAQCLRAGLLVRVGNVAGQGMVIAVPQAKIEDRRRFVIDPEYADHFAPTPIDEARAEHLAEDTGKAAA